MRPRNDDVGQQFNAMIQQVDENCAETERLPESSSRAVLPEVQAEIQHIQAILDDLLAYAQPRPPEFHPADLNATVEQAVFLARQQVRTKPIEITPASEKKLPKILIDPVQING